VERRDRLRARQHSGRPLPGARSSTLDLDWIDKRDMSPVGYQRINKTTGKPVDKDDIVKGYQYSKGRYVDPARRGLQAGQPEGDADRRDQGVRRRTRDPAAVFETPYRLAPGKRGEKGYALLRETLRETDKVGIAEVVIRSKQHLAR
jgi:DNA end-binding protein Ku